MEASVASVVDLATNPRHSRWISPVLLAAEAVLGALIIWKIPCKIELERLSRVPSAC